VHVVSRTGGQWLTKLFGSTTRSSKVRGPELTAKVNRTTIAPPKCVFRMGLMSRLPRMEVKLAL
jgi:hypothetical protein